MSISTYAELKTAVANWGKRSDLTDRIPEFIAIAEAKIANEVRCAAMQTRSTANISSQYFDTPIGFLEIRDIHINSDPISPLEFLSPKVMSNKFRSGTSGNPSHYTIHGDEFEVKPVPDTTYELEINYIKRFTAFSVDADFNWLLTNHPHIYLYASLISLHNYLESDEQVSKYTNLYKDAVAMLNTAEKRAKYGNILTSRVNTATP